MKVNKIIFIVILLKVINCIKFMWEERTNFFFIIYKNVQHIEIGDENQCFKIHK